MKVLFSLNHFLPEQVAGTELYTFNLARSLQEVGIKVAVLIPFFDSMENHTSHYEGVRVIKYSETSESDRSVVIGKTVPLGLKYYVDILQDERPDLVHFHEISGGRGIGLYHVQAVRSLGIKIVLTCHLSTYSCQTGNLVYKEKVLCDGVIRIGACTECSFQARGLGLIAGTILSALAKGMFATGLNATKSDSKIGTALGFPFVIQEKKDRLKILSTLVDKIVILTKFYKKILESNAVPAEKIILCPQGLTGAPERQSHEISIAPLRLVFVGRISEYKGVHLLLEAIRHIPRQKICLDIFGPVTEDTYAATCRDLAKEMTNISFKGEIESKKVISMLSSYHVLCLPSTFSEMSPLVIQEAFAAGIPVVASDVYGNAEQIQNGVNGWLFKFMDSGSLRNVLEKLIANPALISEAKTFIPGTIGFNEVAKAHVRIYDEVLHSVRESENFDGIVAAK